RLGQALGIEGLAPRLERPAADAGADGGGGVGHRPVSRSRCPCSLEALPRGWNRRPIQQSIDQLHKSPFALSLSKGRSFPPAWRKKDSPSTSSGRTACVGGPVSARAEVLTFIQSQAHSRPRARFLHAGAVVAQ